MTTFVLNTKINKVENRIAVVTNLVTNSVLNINIWEAENKVPAASNLVKKPDISNLVKNSVLNKKLATFTTKAELKAG